MSKTLEQLRAEYAFNVINKIRTEKKEVQQEFSSLVKKMPYYILANGLGNTLAFLFAKGKEHHLMVADIIADWILLKFDLFKDSSFNKGDEYWYLNKNSVKEKEREILQKLVLDVESSKYILITNEVLLLFQWLKRFAEGLLEDKSKEEG